MSRVLFMPGAFICLEPSPDPSGESSMNGWMSMRSTIARRCSICPRSSPSARRRIDDLLRERAVLGQREPVPREVEPPCGLRSRNVRPFRAATDDPLQRRPLVPGLNDRWHLRLLLDSSVYRLVVLRRAHRELVNDAPRCRPADLLEVVVHAGGLLLDLGRPRQVDRRPDDDWRPSSRRHPAPSSTSLSICSGRYPGREAVDGAEES